MEKKYTLPREFGEKWVDALRSGKYIQIKEYYAKDGCFCGVGLGCYVNGIGVGEKSILDHPLRSNIQEMEDDIIEINDEGFTFTQIADWIEQNVQFI